MATTGSEKGSEEQGQKLDENCELKDGPCKKRGCTDAICIPIFLAHIVAFYVLTFMNAGKADPMKLIKPMDYKGGFCGIGSSSQWKGSGMNLENFPKQMWSMNVDEIFGPQAKAVVCSAVGKSYLVPSAMTTADFEAHCGIDSSTFAVITDQASALISSTQDTVAAFTDPGKAFNLFTGAQSNIGTSIMKEVTKNFNMVCTSTCGLNRNTSTTEEWMYSPSKATVWGTDRTKPAYDLWTKFTEKVGPTSTLLNVFKFQVWPQSSCPYTDRRYCIPTPGVEFTEPGDFNACIPKIDSGVGQIIGSSLSSTYDGLASLSVTEDAQRTLGDVIGDILKTWPVFIIVAVLSFVLGLLVLVLMRFVLAPLVWGSILIVLVLLVGGAFLLFVRAGQCKGQSFSDAASAAASAASIDLPECGEYGGYDIEHDDARTWTKIASFVVMGIGALFLLGTLCMCCRIRLAIAINQVACQFMYNNPGCLFVPIIQNLISFIWVLFWVFCAAFILSTVPDDYVPSDTYSTYAIAFGTSDTAGKCTDSWPAGGVYIDNDACSTAQADGSYNCYKCSAPRFTFGWEFLYAFFSFQWHNFFIVAVGQCTIAGAVGIWFFAKDKTAIFRSTITTGLKNALFWHSGSLAFGSLVLAIIATIKWVMAYLAKQAKQAKNPVAEKIFQCLGYIIWCFEKCVKFLNKNAYIQIALMGTGFCKSAKNAFWLILRNAVRFMVICMLSFIVHFLAMALIISATAVAGYFILQAMYEDVNPITPTIIFAFIGWFTAKLFVGVFALSVDSCLQCFIAAEEMKCAHQAPEPLKKFLKDHDAEKEGCCDSCCCTVM
jgi:hypothetical protein